MSVFDNVAERFAEQMSWITIEFDDDEEVRHIKMDELMCETLEEFGCHEGVKIFKETKKWYA